MLTWLWLSALALLLGAELNAEAERSRELRQGEAGRAGAPGADQGVAAGRATLSRGPRSSVDRAADFESACGGSTPPGLLARAWGESAWTLACPPGAMWSGTVQDCSELPESVNHCRTRVARGRLPTGPTCRLPKAGAQSSHRDRARLRQPPGTGARARPPRGRRPRGDLDVRRCAGTAATARRFRTPGSRKPRPCLRASAT